MTSISNDHELKLALDGLSPQQQRVLGGRFVKNVLNLCDDSRISRAVDIATDPEASDLDLAEAFRSAKAVSVKTYTDCGKDTDWMAQAAHFVAAAAAASLAPTDQGKGNPAWKAAMQARMARNCELIEQGDGSEHGESEEQFGITAEFMK